MSIDHALASELGDQGIANLARAFGLTESQARDVLGIVGNELAWNLERNTLSRGGLADLIGALGDGTHGAVPSDLESLQGDDVRKAGNAILGHIVGSRDKSRAIAAYTARQTGLSQTLIKQMLPYVASILMGVLASKMKGGLGDILSKLPGAGSPSRPMPPSSSDSGGSITLPRSGGGNPSSYQGGSPLPLPSDDLRRTLPGGSNNPYGDLTDILRRGGGGQGGDLWSIVRSILGGVLGFGSRGVVGWFLTLIVSRFGWRILRFLLGRVLGGR